MTNRTFVAQPDKQDMRDAYCDALISAAEQNERVLSLNCDLSGSLEQDGFAHAFQSVPITWALWKRTPARWRRGFP
jgi:transketolase C-terminal domain/subunit